jgi:BarA-like signal transduction histidine kinase
LQRIDLSGDDIGAAVEALFGAAQASSQPLSTTPVAVGSHSVFAILARIDDLILALCASLAEVTAALRARLIMIADEMDLLDRRLGAGR